MVDNLIRTMFQVSSVGAQMGSATCTFTWVIWAQEAGNMIMPLSLENHLPGNRKRGESVTLRAGVFHRGPRPQQLVPLRPQAQLIRLQLPLPHRMILAGYSTTHTTNIDVLILPRISGSGRHNCPVEIPYDGPHRAHASASRVAFDALMCRSLKN